MVQYTLKEDPEAVIKIPGKDSKKAREQAMNQLMDLMDGGKLNTTLNQGFSPSDFIEVQAVVPTQSSPQEDEVAQAVQILNLLASLKLKMQELQQKALETRAIVDLLFSDAPISEEDVSQLKEGFKVLKKFAQASIQYRQTRMQAKSARATLDRALQSK